MNFSFEIIPFYKGRKAIFYTIVIEDDELSEADKFLSNERVNQNKYFADLQKVFRNLLNKFGARQQFFKDEGLPGDMVNTFFVQRGDLRWYCLRWSCEMIIFGNGGVKHVRATQEDNHLMKCEYALRWVNHCFETSRKNGTIYVNDDGQIVGNLFFNKDDFI